MEVAEKIWELFYAKLENNYHPTSLAIGNQEAELLKKEIELSMVHMMKDECINSNDTIEEFFNDSRYIGLNVILTGTDSHLEIK